MGGGGLLMSEVPLYAQTLPLCGCVAAVLVATEVSFCNQGAHIQEVRVSAFSPRTPIRVGERESSLLTTYWSESTLSFR